MAQSCLPLNLRYPLVHLAAPALTLNPPERCELPCLEEGRGSMVEPPQCSHDGDLGWSHLEQDLGQTVLQKP